MKEQLRKKPSSRIRRACFHNRFLSAVLAELILLASPKQSWRIERRLRSLEQYGKINGLTDEKTKRNALFHMFFSRLFYACDYTEYFLYGLDENRDPGKKDYVGSIELNHYFSLLNKIGRPDIFNGKVRMYQAIHDYYHREQTIISSAEEKESFLSFFQKHTAGIVKPIRSFGGKGVEIIRISDDTSTEQLWEHLQSRIPFVLEELIEQAPEMSAFYPHAVNTIRYNTFFYDGKLTRMQAAFRMGRGGKCVDNATSGGIYTLVDTETGRIKGPARSDLAERFENHPDTGVPFEGSYIPRWDELNKLVEKVVRVAPEQKQVGWDFALSKDGWVMVEGNSMPAIQSFDLEHGMRKEITELYRKVIPVWT